MQRKVAALGLVQQACCEASANGVQLHLGDRALEPKEKPSVRGARVVHAIAVANEALPVAAQIEQRVPVRAVPAEPGHFRREHDAHLAQRDARDQVLEAFPVRRRSPAQAEISVDYLDILRTPAEIESTPAEVVLKP